MSNFFILSLGIVSSQSECQRERAKAIAQFFCKERRLFKCSEMAAAIELVPVNEHSERFARPFLLRRTL